MKNIILCCLMLVLFSFAACAKKENLNPETDTPALQPRFATAQEINKRLSRGINLGNVFEAAQSWGNTKYSHDYLKIIADMGFKHVRIPIRWERPDRSSATAPYTINKAFLDSIKHVIDNALKNKLHVIINMHHHDSLFANAAANKERFLAQWKQIAAYYQSYPDSLLFEVLNEPNETLTSTLWNQYFADALSEIRKTNPERTVLMGVADWGGVGGLKALQIPADKHLILTIHYYNPFQFTHQGAGWVDNSTPWLGTKWSDYQYERDAVVRDFKLAKSISSEKNIPIHIGEFGAYSKADMDSRVRWTRFVARWFEEQNFSWAYWEFNSGFGVYDMTASKPIEPLVQALLHSKLPEAQPMSSVLIYKSDFSTGKDGWNLYNNHNSATSTSEITDGKLKITITKPGDETWYLQLIKNGFILEKDKKYLVKFNAFSTSLRTIHAGFMQAASPWTTYGSSGSIDIDATDTEYSFVFNSSVNDPNARIVFSMGNSGLAPVTLHHIQLYQIKDDF